MIYCSVCNKKIEECKCERPFKIETKTVEKVEKKQVKEDKE